MDEYLEVNWVASSHHSSVSRKTSELFICGLGKQKICSIIFRQHVFGNKLLITDKHVIIILFSSGGQLLIA